MRQLITLLLALCFGGAMAQKTSIKEQLLLRFEENYITQLAYVNPKLHKYYVMELENSFEVVNLEEGIEYTELESFNYKTGTPKEAPICTDIENFSLYNYKINRHLTEDVIYKIPNSGQLNKGIKLFSKNKFNYNF